VGHITSEAQHRVVGAPQHGTVLQPAIFRQEVQEADGKRPGLPREAPAPEDVVVEPDATAEEEIRLPVVPELEELGALQKEIPLLRVEEAEAAQVDLDVVGLHLREVGVVGQIGCQRRRHAPFHVEAHIVGGPGVFLSGHLLSTYDSEGLHLHMASWPEALQPR
jgi:hypothetical protein